jgi:hypothetical protein
MDKRKLAAAVPGLVLIGGLSAGAAWAQYRNGLISLA